ncbi:hypothetical protein GCM10025868_36950 [Angustibacter aerolatus]|uniref:Protein-glutamine gamma-glutamyltransferase-like C-terminal domain-containing protein n=1 Tax=Angustibacter aerolatus TaxID=1162965 RepID=A0ABQ6JMG6_9ACTN|nr:DUF4129 domain-containing protein [Angustibacter aerolatus]GMA88445.1 hypothetical protein GCM10025868_36950 [Angustibacter aerolatus]
MAGPCGSLGDDVYQRARPGLVTRAAQWLLDHLGRLQAPGVAPDARTGVVLLALVVIVVVVVVLLRTGRLRGPGRVGASRTVFGEVERSAAEHRRLADAAADAGEWGVAVRERFRAVVRSLEERTVLDARPGRTAHEVAVEAGVLLPALADDLARCAGVFDAVAYGGRPATAQHDRVVRDLDAAVGEARPTWAPVAT